MRTRRAIFLNATISRWHGKHEKLLLNVNKSINNTAKFERRHFGGHGKMGLTCDIKNGSSGAHIPVVLESHGKVQLFK